jgi:hypothetical protein
MASKHPRTSRSRASVRDVSGFLAQLEHPRKAEIELLRTLILSVDDRVGEELKWNAPSFYLSDHFATFKLQPPGTVQLVLHTGAKVRPDARAIEVDDPSRILKWPAKDRALATFSDLNDIEAKKTQFVSILKQWIAHLDGMNLARS